MNNRLWKVSAFPLVIMFFSVLSITQNHYILWLGVSDSAVLIYTSEINIFSQPLQNKQSTCSGVLFFDSNVVFHYTDKLCLCWPTADWNVKKKKNIVNASLHGWAKHYLISHCQLHNILSCSKSEINTHQVPTAVKRVMRCCHEQ